MQLVFRIALAVCAISLAQCQNSVNLCLDNQKAVEKCNDISDMLKAKNSPNNLVCTKGSDCIKSVENGESDAVIVDSDMHPDARKNLEAVLFESYDENNLIVALVDADKESKIHDLPLSYKNKNDLRLLHSALYINHHRNDGKCAKVVRDGEGDSITLERYHEIKNSDGKKLVCIENGKLVTKPVSQFKDCHVESNIPNAVMIKKGSDKKEAIKQTFLEAAKTNGNRGQVALFGPYKGTNDLIFSDETKQLIEYHSEPNGVSVDKFLDLHCGVPGEGGHDHAHDHSHSHDHSHDHDHDHDHDHHH